MIRNRGFAAEQLRLLKYMIYREAGGIGYDRAINKLAYDHAELYKDTMHKIHSIKKDL